LRKHFWGHHQTAIEKKIKYLEMNPRDDDKILLKENMYCVIEEDDSKYWYGKMIDPLEIRVCYIFGWNVARNN
jgi:hypothetical protein